MHKPLIGISAYDYVRPGVGWRYDICYARNAVAIETAGGLPVLIPSRVSADVLRGIYERLDAVLLPGGGDINPDNYQDRPRTELKHVDDTRDAMELNLTRWAADDDLPVLGICRGIQVMNVALGGSLTQDIPSMLTTDYRHNIEHGQEPRNLILHDVTVKADTRLRSILGEESVQVNSIHHQAIKDLAPDLIDVAYAPDGIIEGVELPDRHFFMAVQWHPEDLTDDDERMRNLFKAFVDAASQRIKA